MYDKVLSTLLCSIEEILLKKTNFPARISLVNVTKSADLVIFIEEICNGKLQKSLMEKMFCECVNSYFQSGPMPELRIFTHFWNTKEPKSDFAEWSRAVVITTTASDIISSSLTNIHFSCKYKTTIAWI